jgi:hypothetical protein
MPSEGPLSSPAGVGRVAFGVATVLTAVLGFAGDGRWFAASGAFGTLWWFWDLVWGNVVAPFGDWLNGLLTGAAVSDAGDLTLDDTIRMLEDHLRDEGVSRHVCIQSALRLAELYRFARKDPERAAEVLRLVRSRYPDAPELARFEKEEAGP